MTVLEVAKAASLRLGLNVPTMLFSSTDREMLEMQEVVNESARVIAEAYPWQILQKIATFTGTGSQVDFILPSDYDRMLPTSSLWSSRWAWNAEHVASPDDWLSLEVGPSGYVTGRWIIFGGQLHLKPAMPSGQTTKFFYVSKQIVTGASGNPDLDAPKASFTLDSDLFNLDERLLKLAVIWRWKAGKGLPYAEDMENYEEQLDKATDKDKGSKPVVSGQPLYMRDRVKLAWPGTVGPAL